MRNWTLEAIAERKHKGKMRSLKSTPVKPVKSTPKGLAYIISVLERLNIQYLTEYKFHAKRKFRFDVAIPSLKLAVEYEGVMSAKSRHTSVTGYSNDAIKYNLAQIEGWKIFRYTVLNYQEFENDLSLLKQQNDDIRISNKMAGTHG